MQLFVLQGCPRKPTQEETYRTFCDSDMWSVIWSTSLFHNSLFFVWHSSWASNHLIWPDCHFDLAVQVHPVLVGLVVIVREERCTSGLQESKYRIDTSWLVIHFIFKGFPGYAWLLAASISACFKSLLKLTCEDSHCRSTPQLGSSADALAPGELGRSEFLNSS